MGAGATDNGSTRPTLLILGMGNEILSDDGVGLVALEHSRGLIGERGYPVELHFKKLNTAGLDLIFEVEGYEHLLVVDAYFAEDSRPGRGRGLSPEDLGGPSQVDSAHLISLPDALKMSKKHGYHTPDLIGAVVIDVGESCLVFAEGIGEEMRLAAEEAGRIVADMIESFIAKVENP